MKLNTNNLNNMLLYDNSHDRFKKVYLKKLTKVYNEHFLTISSEENFSSKLNSSCWVDTYNDKERIFFKAQTNKVLGSFVKATKILFSNNYLDDFRFFEQSPVFDLKRVSLKLLSRDILKTTLFYKSVLVYKPKRGGFVVCWQGIFGLFPKTQISLLKKINRLLLSRNSNTFFFTHFKSYLKIKNSKRKYLKNEIKLNNIFIFSLLFFLTDLLPINKKTLDVSDLKYKYVSELNSEEMDDFEEEEEDVEYEYTYTYDYKYKYKYDYKYNFNYYIYLLFILIIISRFTKTFKH